MEITIFTDGSSRGNPGPGGWGVIIVYNDSESKVESEKLKVREFGGREGHTTNNRMELEAVIQALSFVSDFKLYTLHFQLFIDSSYVVNGITKWVYGWQKNGWRTKTKAPVENQDLWEKLVDVTVGKKIDWKVIGGHIGIAGNERCDEIATQFADRTRIGRWPDAEMRLFSGPLSEYPVKNILDIKIDGEKKAKKSTDRNHSRAKAYSYISLVDGVIKIHKTWAECEARVKGKNGVKFKKSLSKEDEQKIIDSWKK